MFHAPSNVWCRLLTFIAGDADIAIEVVLHCRRLYPAWRTFTFPVSKKRKKRVVPVTTSAPSKRRKIGVMDSDIDTEPEDNSDNGNRENVPTDGVAVQLAERSVVRELRYEQLQSELRESGSIRVLNKRVTSALWAARLPLQPIDNVQ